MSNAGWLRQTTEDGSPTLWSEAFGEAYHSRIGALTEAREKFLRPYLEVAETKTDLKILDACFGLGYNSFVFIEHFLKRSSVNVEIVAVEKDPSLLPSLEWVIPFFPDLEKPIRSLIQNRSFENKWLSIRLCHLPLEALYLEPESFSETGFDLILHDAFSPAKCTELWCVELFQEYFRRMNDGGIFVTYASALPVAAGLIECGFSVKTTTPVGRKRGGLLAQKDGLRAIEKELAEFYAQTTAKAPYRSAGTDLSDPAQARLKILAAWETEKQKLVACGKSTIRKYLANKAL